MATNDAFAIDEIVNSMLKLMDLSVSSGNNVAHAALIQITNETVDSSILDQNFVSAFATYVNDMYPLQDNNLLFLVAV